MKQLFIKGFVFGAGFCCAVLLFGVVVKVYIESGTPQEFNRFTNDRLEWKNLTPQEKLKSTKMMVLVRYKDGEDGVKVAYVDDVFCKKPDCDTEYSLGDNVPEQDFYPDPLRSKHEAVILLFKESGQLPMSTWFVYDNRVGAIGHMPLETLKKKFINGT